MGSGATNPMRSDPEQLHWFLLEVGRALSLAGTAVSETQDRLSRIASANGVADARIVVLPTALMISVREAHETTIDAIPQLTGALRLDQISVLYEVVKRAERGELDLADGMAQLHAIRTMRPRYGPVVTVLSYAAMIAGLCLILRPTPLDVLVSAIFGAFVGTLVLLGRGRHTLRVLLPIIAAMIVSALTFQAVQYDLLDPGLRTLIAPLVTFLPGGVLTTATVELATGEMVAGASRLVFGFLQLLLLAFGIVAGAELAGLPKNIVLQDAHTMVLGPWAPWLGVLIFGVAVSFYFSAPRGSLFWLLLVLLTAWVGQLVGEALVGANTSGFFGAIAMTPVALAVAQVPGGPPSQVTFLPAFWLLVPGALGLVGITQILGDPAVAEVGDLVQPLAAIVAIALGVLCGTSIYRGTEFAIRRRPGRRR